MISKKDLQNIRAEYSSKILLKESLQEQAMDQFALWFKEALDSQVHEVNAMTLATCGKDGRPSSRIVLLKSFDENGFVFYTNYDSNKGKQMEENPFVSLTFFWQELERQVRIEGEIIKVSEKESLEYFQSRPRLSQLGAVVSNQSTEIESREALEKIMAEVSQKFDGQEIPKPKNWGGYLVQPLSVEFWQGRPGRLHDRLVFMRPNLDTQTWNVKRLCP